MGLKKCPRCELNYIKDDEKYCNVCKRYMKGESDEQDAVTMCTECGENPVVKGSDLCAICLREARRQAKLSNAGDDTSEAGRIVDLDDESLDDIEVPLPGDGDIPEKELEEIDKELGGDDEEEDEESEEIVDEDN